MNAVYRLEFDQDWDKYFAHLDNLIRQILLKKLEQLKAGLPARHLKHGVDYFVAEVGQYRICFKNDEKNKVRRIYFAGDHKDYDKWIQEQ